MNEKIYLESIVKPLLAHPEELKIESSNDDRGILITITAHNQDMGRLIGKAGTTANAMRTLMRQYGVLNEKRISVKINDPVGYTPRPKSYENDREMLEN